MNSLPTTADRPASWLGRTRNLVLALLLDLVIVIVSYALALYLKFDGSVPNESWHQLLWAGPLIAFAYILAYSGLVFIAPPGSTAASAMPSCSR